MTKAAGAPSASKKKTPVINDAVREAAKPRGRRKTQATEQNDSLAQMQENPFFKAFFEGDFSPEERRDAITSLTISSLDSKQDRENIRSLDAFREWLSSERTRFAENIIAISNVDSMAELQAVLKDMNTDLLNFEDRINPIMDIIESIHYLRTNGLIGDAFRQIQTDKDEEEKRLSKIVELELKIAEEKKKIETERLKKAEAQTQRSFFGMGGPTKNALRTMALAEDAIKDAEKTQKELTDKINALKSKAPESSDMGEHEVHKRKLRELLDMSKDENTQRMIELRDAGSGFISTARDRTGSLRGQFEQLAQQIESVEDSGKNMIKVHAIMNDGMSKAATQNSELRETLVKTPEDEALLDKMTREEKLRALDTHVDYLSRAQAETMSAFGELNQQAIRVNTMRGATDQQIETARRINTEGVAATADRLATVLTAVGGAALGEASEAAKDTLNRMRQSTNEIASREVIRVAMGTSQINDQLDIVFNELEDIRDIQQTATGITRNAMTEMRERMADIQDSANAAREELGEHIASASVTNIDDEQATKTAQTPSASTGFPSV